MGRAEPPADRPSLCACWHAERGPSGHSPPSPPSLVPSLPSLAATSTWNFPPLLLKEGYEVLLSHTDYVYLDCGEPGWVKPGGYWCEPFHEWFQMYGYINDIKKIWGITDTTNI